MPHSLIEKGLPRVKKKIAPFNQKTLNPTLIEGYLKIDKLAYDKPLELQVVHGDSVWSDKILNDLILENNHHSEKDKNSKKDILITITVEKKHSGQLDDFVFVFGKVKIIYPAECVRCLAATQQEISCSLNTCFVKNSFEDSPEYRDSTEIYINSQDRDLHFYKSNQIDIKSVILEEVYVNKNHFPLHNDDCRGLCPICGENLNKSSCKHQKGA